MYLKHMNVTKRKGMLMITPQFLVEVTEEKFDSFYNHMVCRTLLVVCHLLKQCLPTKFWYWFDAETFRDAQRDSVLLEMQKMLH